MVVQRGRDGQHHGLQAAFDALGDLDFAFAVSSSTVPISRMYMRTGSVVRPNSESTVDSAASAASLGFFFGRGGLRAVGDQQRGRVRRLLVTATPMSFNIEK